MAQLRNFATNANNMFGFDPMQYANQNFGYVDDAPGQPPNPDNPQPTDPGGPQAPPPPDPHAPPPAPPSAPPPTRTPWKPPPMPIGYQADKWNDESHQTAKYKAGRIIAGGGSFDDAFNALGSGFKKHGKDSVVETATGDIWDLIFDEDNAAGQRRAQWTHVGNVNGGGGGGGGNSGSTALRPPEIPSLTAPGAGTFPNFSSFKATGVNGATDDLTQMVTQGYGDLQNYYRNYLSPEQSNARKAGAIEGARETMERGRKVQLRNMQNTLADRGLLSEPGIVQGPEISSLARLEDSIAPVYSQALREALATEDQNQLQASSAYESSLRGAGQYQGVIANIALQELGQDIDFQKFLAQHGLDQARLQFEIENGNINNVLALFQLYLNAAKIAADGYV